MSGLGPAAQPPREPESFALSQCAVVQVGASPRLYLSGPSGEVEGVDLRTGGVLWHTASAAFPLMVRGDRLLALLPPVPRTPAKGQTPVPPVPDDRVTRKYSLLLSSSLINSPKRMCPEAPIVSA